MADVVVTRADREAALRALHDGLEWLAAGWVMTGRDGSDELGRAALAIAKARAEGFAAGREAERRTRVAVPSPAMPSIDAMRASAVHYIRSRGEVGATTADLYAGWVCALVDLVKALEGGGSNG